MGISAYVVFEENKSIPIETILKDIEKFCVKLNLFYAINTQKKENNHLKYTIINISDLSFEKSSSRQLCIEIYDEPHKFQYMSFDWYNQNINFFEAMVIDNFYNNEDLLLKFLYNIGLNYTNSKFWIENDWFYTLDDLKKLLDKPFSKGWYYKNPKEIV